MHGLTHPIKLTATAAALLLSSGFHCTAAPAQTNAVRQPLYLPDPTPRPPDLEKIYADDPAQKAREQQMIRIENAKRRMEITTYTDGIAALAEQLRESLRQSAAENDPALNARKVAEIQKLAKAIKNLEKLQ